MAGPRSKIKTLKGDPFHQLEDGRTDEFGQVFRVHAGKHCCDVSTESGRTLFGVNFPDAGGAVSVPHIGAQVLVSYQAGIPILRAAPPGVSAVPTAGNQLFTDTAATVGSRPGLENEDAALPNLAASGPTEILPGDWVRMGRDGNYLATLAGGVNVMRSGDYAMISTSKEDETVRLTGRNIEMLAGAGNFKIETKDGKTSFVLDLGADEATESRGDKENFRVRAALGQRGNIASLRLTDGKGHDAYKFHALPDGSVNTKSKNMVSVIDNLWRTGARDIEFVAGRKLKINSGNGVKVVSGGSIELESDGRASLIGVGGFSVSTMGAGIISASSGLNMQLRGTTTVPLPYVTNALKVAAANGSVRFDIGNPVALDAGIARSAFEVMAWQGPVRLTSLVEGIALDTLVPGLCKIGGPPLGLTGPVLPGPVGAVTWEGLLAFFEVFGNMLDTHIHAITSPVPGSPTLPPAVPIWNVARGSLALARSIFVTLGG